MSAVVLKFQRQARRRVERTDRRTGVTHVTGFPVGLEVRSGEVLFTADGIELGLSPAEARELAADLLESADDADEGRAG